MITSLYPLIVVPCFMLFFFFCWFMDQRQKRLDRPKNKWCAAMNATTELSRLEKERDNLCCDDYLDYKHDIEIERDIAKCKATIAVVLPEKKDPYLELAEAEVEILLS